MEKEQNNSISFLDIKIERNYNATPIFKTSVYRKPTSTNQYLQFSSHQPKKHKISVIKTLAHRARTICKDEESLQTEMDHLRDSFKQNGYPSSFTNKYLQETSPRPSLNRDRPVGSVTLPYLQGLSEHTRRIFK